MTNPTKLPTLITLHIRLDRSNYTYWRSQILAIVRAHCFEDVLFCSAPPAAEEGTSDSPVSLSWLRRDQFLLSWMLSSITDSMLGHVNRCAHSFQVWKTLDDLFQSQSKARSMNLRFQLQTLKKGSSSVDEYFLQMRSIADGLLAAGHSLSDDDLVLYVLGGLGAEFDAVVVSLTTGRELPSLSEVHSILHIHEMRLL